MNSIIKRSGKYSVTMTEGDSYYAVVTYKTAEWYCFNINKKGTYKITCNGRDNYTIIEESPPPSSSSSLNKE
tara:strand:+ start:419 stop:634 length:216 start_codon:yes stop_codon:yes gene_type:complete